MKKLAPSIMEHIQQLEKMYVLAEKIDNANVDLGPCINMGLSLLFYGRKSLEDGRVLARQVGDIIQDHHWKMGAPWFACGVMLMQLDFENVPIQIRLEFKPEDFPMDEVSPGCSLNKTERVETEYAIVCPMKDVE
jgi:hypothetical protein